MYEEGEGEGPAADCESGAAAVAAAVDAVVDGQDAEVEAATEAVAGMHQQQQAEVSEEVVEMVEHEEEPLTVQLAAQRTSHWMTQTTPGRLTLLAVASVVVGSFGMAVYRAWQKANTGRAKRLRQIDRNRGLVDSINQYLPANRAALTPGVLKGIVRSSGFSAVEVFRKYLWYLLRERRFDQGAVEDLVVLKSGLGLADADAAEALRERSQRVYDKYGSLMLNTEGMTLQGAQRKATCTALFRKVLYLAETERLVGPAAADEGRAEQVADIRKIFGATEEDLSRLRIKNLYEAEVDLEALVAEDDDDADKDTDGGGSGKTATGGSGSS